MNPASNIIWQRQSQKFQQEIYDEGYSDGWRACQRRVMEILLKSHQNLDLSWDECDVRYIKEVNQL